MTDHQEEEEDKKNPSKAEAGAAPAEQEAPASAYEGRQQPSIDEVQTGTRTGRGAVAPTGPGASQTSRRNDGDTEAQREGGGAAKERKG
jgi:hypothetical protein